MLSNGEGMTLRQSPRPGPDSHGAFFVARVAKENDIPALVGLAQETDVGNIKADAALIAREIEMSHRTLQGDVPWKQGMLFLVTDYYDGRHAPFVVGQAKIRWAFGSCWLKVPRTRIWEETRSMHHALVYHSERSAALEFAGNAVSEKHQSQGIGSFQIKTRILFVLLHDLPGVTKIFADLLTTDFKGRYPFYEEIVRPLLADLDYDEADRLRYEARGGQVRFFDHHLGATPDGSQPACELMIHALPAHIRKNLGSVRSKTLAAAHALEKYGFTPCDRYDLLDGGQYVETSIDSLRSTIHTTTLAAEGATASDLLLVNSGQRMVFSPVRPMDHFVTACGVAAMHGDRLMVEPDLYRALELRSGEPLRVLLA